MSKNNGPRKAATYRGARRALAKIDRKVARKISGKSLPFTNLWASSDARIGPEIKNGVTRPKPVNPSKHPGANPFHNPNGRERGTLKLPDPVTGQVVEYPYKGPRNPSKYVPHIGKKQRSRRAGRGS